jgi:hypothetical protein
MDIYKSINFLKRYVEQNIDTSSKTKEGEAGVRGLILMVQEKYKIDMGLPQPKEEITDLRYAMMDSYALGNIEELAGREYVSDVLLKKNIDVEDYIKEIDRYNIIISAQKTLPIQEQTEEGYELTHLIWGLYTISKDNHLMRNYKNFMLDSLVNLFQRIDTVTDVSTETLYFISLLDVNSIKEDWIMKLEQDQDINGAFTGYYHYEDFTEFEQKIVQAHHTALALLTLYNFYNEISEQEI